MKLYAKTKIILFISVMLGITYLIGPGWYLIYSPKLLTPQIEITTNSVEEFIKTKESQFSYIKSENESHILWSSENHTKTKYSIVYLHGFSAGPKEISPVLENVASTLQFNSYFPRLSLHGLKNNSMENLTADQLFQDAEESYLVGNAIGQKLIIVGTSTGASLALWLAARHPDIAGFILISPNLGIKNPSGFLAAGPLGYWITRIVVGSYFEWKPKNPTQEFFWTTRYSAQAIRAMTDVVNESADLTFEKIQIPSLTFWTSQDKVVNIQKALSKIRNLGSIHNEFIEFKTTEHVLAGALTEPKNISKASESILKFIKELD